MNSIDGQPFAEALASAAERQWNGVLRAMLGKEQIGMVALCNGRIAWAVSKNQTKNLPVFLEEIGLVPRDRLSEIVQKQSAPGMSKKIGPLLEEAGLITPATYRECLLAHVRSALSSLLNSSLMVAQASKSEVAVDASLTFSLQDALENAEDKTSADGAPSTELVTEEAARSCNGELLENLALLSGYMYSFVANTSGKLLAFHEAEHAGERVEMLFATVTDWLSTSLEAARTLGMGAARVTFMEGVDQSLLVQATDSERQHFLAVAFNEEGKLGVVKTRMASMIPTVQTFTEKR